MDVFAFNVGKNKDVREFIKEKYNMLEDFVGIRFMKNEEVIEPVCSKYDVVFNKASNRHIVLLQVRNNDKTKEWANKQENLVAVADDYDKRYINYFFRHDPKTDKLYHKLQKKYGATYTWFSWELDEE